MSVTEIYLKQLNQTRKKILKSNLYSLPGDATDDGDLIEFMTAVIMAESGRACAGPTPAATAITPRGVTPSTPTISTCAAAPKRLDQSLGAGRHSTKVIQPF